MDRSELVLKRSFGRFVDGGNRLVRQEDVCVGLVSIEDNLVSLVLLVVLWLSNIDGILVVDEGVIPFDKRLERGVCCEVFDSISVGRDGKLLVSAVIELDSKGFFLSFIILVLSLLRLNIFSVFTHSTKNKTKKEKQKNKNK